MLPPKMEYRQGGSKLHIRPLSRHKRNSQRHWDSGPTTQPNSWPYPPTPPTPPPSIKWKQYLCYVFGFSLIHSPRCHFSRLAFSVMNLNYAKVTFHCGDPSAALLELAVLPHYHGHAYWQPPSLPTTHPHPLPFPHHTTKPTHTHKKGWNKKRKMHQKKKLVPSLLISGQNWHMNVKLCLMIYNHSLFSLSTEWAEALRVRW